MRPKIQCIKCSQVILASCCSIVGMFLLGGMRFFVRLGLLFDLPFHFLPSSIVIYQLKESLVHLY